MPESSIDFRSKQAEFVAYIRDPENNVVPDGIKEQRMAMYRELMFNNVEGFLSNNFPVLRKILDDEAWFALAQDFFLKHPSQSPYFSEIPEEFLTYIQHQRSAESGDPEFMLELAHYEWVEMALQIAKDLQPETTKQFLDHPEQHSLVISPLAWPLVYQYPVHQIGPDYLPQKAPTTPTYLIVYRNDELAVKFIEINAMTYRLLEIIQENGEIQAESCFHQITEESGLESNAVVTGGTSILQNLAALGIVCPT